MFLFHLCWIVWWMNEWILSIINMINRYLSTNLIVSFCPIHAVKSGTIGIFASLGKNAISPDRNIQIGWNKRLSKANISFVTLIYVLCRNYFYLHQKARALIRCNFFSDTLYMKYGKISDIMDLIPKFLTKNNELLLLPKNSIINVSISL